MLPQQQLLHCCVIVVVLLFCSLVINGTNVLLSSCFQNIACINITETSCDVLWVSLQYSSETKEANFSIFQLVYDAQQAIDGGTDVVRKCYTLAAGVDICGEVSNLTREGSQLRFCGRIIFKIGNAETPYDIGCSQIDNCELLLCGGNNCSDNGVCSSLGICRCNNFTTGPGCRLRETKNNCLMGASLQYSVCVQKATIDSCGKESTLKLSLQAGTQEFNRSVNIEPNMELQLLDCQQYFPLDCTLCSNASISISGTNQPTDVQVCPSASYVCGGRLQQDYNFDCLTVPVENTNCFEPRTDSTVKETPFSLTSIFLLCIIIAAVVVIGGVLYKSRKFLKQQFLAPTGTGTLVEEEQDLNDEVEEEGGGKGGRVGKGGKGGKRGGKGGDEEEEDEEDEDEEKRMTSEKSVSLEHE